MKKPRQPPRIFSALGWIATIEGLPTKAPTFTNASADRHRSETDRNRQRWSKTPPLQTWPHCGARSRQKTVDRKITLWLREITHSFIALIHTYPHYPQPKRTKLHFADIAKPAASGVTYNRVP